MSDRRVAAEPVRTSGAMYIGVPLTELARLAALGVSVLSNGTIPAVGGGLRGRSGDGVAGSVPGGVRTAWWLPVGVHGP